MRLTRFGAVAAAASLSVQPCLAADDMPGRGGAERRSAAFTCVHLRVPMGRSNSERPSARLQLTSFHDYRDEAGATVRSHRAPGVELGLTRAGRPALFVAGSDLRQTRERLGASGSTRTWLIVGGVTLALVVLVAVASGHPTPGPREGDF